MTNERNIITPATAAHVVARFIEALNDDDFDTAQNQLHDDVVFTGVLGAREGVGPYMDDMRKMRLKYDIKKIVADDTDVAVFYEITMSGKPVFCAGWYHVEDEKIKWFKVVFDPRPVLDQKK